MRETQPLTPPKLLVIESQRDFPDEDLSEANALYLSHELVANQSEQAHAASFDTHLVPLFRLGHEALQMSELPSEDSRASYETFCDGFAASEFAMTFVRPTMYDGTRAVQATSELLRGGVAASNILANNYQDWLSTHANMFGVIADISVAREDTIKQTQSRAMGACAAMLFQRGSLFVP